MSAFQRGFLSAWLMFAVPSIAAQYFYSGFTLQTAVRLVTVTPAWDLCMAFCSKEIIQAMDEAFIRRR